MTRMRSLIIDDDPVSRQVVRTALEEFGPCAEAATGLQGVQLFAAALRERDPFDLVVSDVLMSGMDGHQTINALREAERAAPDVRPTPILVMTTLEHFADIRGLRQKGAPVEFLPKPLDRARLRTILQHLDLA